MTAAAHVDMESVEIDIPITLKVGAERDIGRSRFRVLYHIYGQKPHLKLVGAASDRTCPECRGVFCNQHGLRSHFSRMHGHLAWPWPGSRPSKPDKPARTRKVKQRTQVTYPKWRTA